MGLGGLSYLIGKCGVYSPLEDVPCSDNPGQGDMPPGPVGQVVNQERRMLDRHPSGGEWPLQNTNSFSISDS